MSEHLGPDWYETRDLWHIPAYLPDLGRRVHGAALGSARLATRRELEPLLAPPGNGAQGLALERISVIHDAPNQERGCDALYRRTLHLPEELALRHLLGVGGTGCGKSTKLVVPLLMAALADPESSVAVLVAKADLLSAVYAIAARTQKSLRILTFSDPVRSAAWNPAASIADRGHALRIGHRLCHAIEKPRGQDSPFWIGNSEKAIAGILLAEATTDGGRPSLPRVREVLELPIKEMLAYCEEHGHVPQLQNFGQYLRGGSHNAETILADAQMRMNSYLDEGLCAVTDVSELQFDELVDEPSVFVVEMDETRLPEHRPTWNLFLSSLLDRLVYRADRMPRGRLARPTWVFIDEFASSVGRIPNFEVRLNTLRSRRVGVVAAVQSLGQLATTYGTAADAVLAGFSTKVFFPGLEHGDKEYASVLGGTSTVAMTMRHRHAGPFGVQETTETHAVPRRLLWPDDIGTPPDHPLLGQPTTWFLPGKRPFMAWMTSCYERAVWRDIEREAPDRLPRDRSRRRGPLVYERGADAKPPPAPPAEKPETARVRSRERLDPRTAMLRTIQEGEVVSLGPWAWEVPGAPTRRQFRHAIRIAGERLRVQDAPKSARRLWGLLLESEGAALRTVFLAVQHLVVAVARWEEYAEAWTACPVRDPMAAYHHLQIRRRQGNGADGGSS